jgi:hypothetical protein
MSDQTQHHSYHVHLKANVAEELGVDSPVETERIDYYDSGLWVSRDEGRDFYPYENVLTVHERPASGETVTDEATAEEEDATADADD